MKIAVLTSLFGKERLRSLNEWELSYDVDYFSFVSKEHNDSYGWTQIVSPKFSHYEEWSDRRNAKIYKILPDLFLPDYDVHVWVDSEHILIKDPHVMCENMSDYDMMAFSHWERSCAYEELGAISDRELDDPKSIREQLKYFYLENFPRNYGLYELPCFIRKNNKLTKEMGLMWWEMICRFTSRDQTTFPYVLWKMNKIKINNLGSGANCTPLCSIQEAVEGRHSGNPFFFASGLLS